MPKALWTGSLAFGLVNIPVRLYPATEPKDVRFHLMDARGRRVRYRRFVETERPEEDWTPSDVPKADAGTRLSYTPSSGTPRQPDEFDEEIAYEDLMRGIERDDGSVVLLGDDEIRSVQPERSRTIDIEDFVELNDIDPVYFEKSYIVAPQRDAEKPYALLLSAMERSGRVGMAGSCFGRSLIWSRSARRTARWPSRRCSSATRFAKRSDWSATSAQPSSPIESSNSRRS